MGVPGVNALKITRLESNIDVVPSILKMMGQRSRKIFTIFLLLLFRRAYQMIKNERLS